MVDLRPHGMACLGDTESVYKVAGAMVNNYLVSQENEACVLGSLAVPDPWKGFEDARRLALGSEWGRVNSNTENHRTDLDLIPPPAELSFKTPCSLSSERCAEVLTSH